jgi:hypothetical protein
MLVIEGLHCASPLSLNLQLVDLIERTGDKNEIDPTILFLTLLRRVVRPWTVLSQGCRDDQHVAEPPDIEIASRNLLGEDSLEIRKAIVHVFRSPR